MPVTLTFRRLGRSEWIASPAYDITEGDVTGIDFHLHALTTWPATVHASKAWGGQSEIDCLSIVRTHLKLRDPVCPTVMGGESASPLYVLAVRQRSEVCSDLRLPPLKKLKQQHLLSVSTVISCLRSILRKRIGHTASHGATVKKWADQKGNDSDATCGLWVYISPIPSMRRCTNFGKIKVPHTFFLYSSACLAWWMRNEI